MGQQKIARDAGTSPSKPRTGACDAAIGGREEERSARISVGKRTERMHGPIRGRKPQKEAPDDFQKKKLLNRRQGKGETAVRESTI